MKSVTRRRSAANFLNLLSHDVKLPDQARSSPQILRWLPEIWKPSSQSKLHSDKKVSALAQVTEPWAGGGNSPHRITGKNTDGFNFTKLNTTTNQ